MRYACAGHPYPLLLTAGGSARLLRDGRGGSLASWSSAGYAEGRARLSGLDAGFALLAEAAGALAGRRVEDVCDGLLAAMGADGAAGDIALLVARRTPPA